MVREDHAPRMTGPLSVSFTDLQLLGVLCLNKSACSDSVAWNASVLLSPAPSRAECFVIQYNGIGGSQREARLRE